MCVWDQCPFGTPSFPSFFKLYCSKQTSCHCGQIAQPLSCLIIKLFYTRHLACPCGLLQISGRLEDLLVKVLLSWLAPFHVTVMQNLLHCVQWHWCCSSFQFMADLSLSSSWVVPGHPNTFHLIWECDRLGLLWDLGWEVTCPSNCYLLTIV